LTQEKKKKRKRVSPRSNSKGISILFETPFLGVWIHFLAIFIYIATRRIQEYIFSFQLNLDKYV